MLPSSSPSWFLLPWAPCWLQVNPSVWDPTPSLSLWCTRQHNISVNIVIWLLCLMPLQWKSFNCTLFPALNQPSLLPVTISGAPSPIPRPPTPSILLSISLWAFTEYTGTSGISKFLWTNWVSVKSLSIYSEFKQLWSLIGLWCLSLEGVKSVVELPYIKISVKIPSCYVSLLESGGPKGPAFYGFRFLYLKHNPVKLQRERQN